MKALFIHQNFPGQYKHLAPALAARGVEVVALVDEKGLPRARQLLPGLNIAGYRPSRDPSPATHHYLAGTEAQVLRGQAVARAAIELGKKGFQPDVILGHPGWGECLFIKDVFPRAKLALFLEFYYRNSGADVGFDPEFPTSFDHLCKLRMRNTTQLVSLDAADAATSPTHWQRRQYPEVWQPRIDVVHDGIDTAHVCRRPEARVTLPDGRVLTAADEVVTYVSRNLEPYRGFHTFMRALPEILRRRPEAQVLIAGGDDVSYGARPGNGKTWRELMLAEVGGDPDMSRVHFLGNLPYERYLDLLSISRAHVYLTYPFVLSWSMLEAMACGAVVIGSRTPPVEEVVEHGANGFLVDFFSTEQIAGQVEEALARHGELDALRERARATVLERYDLRGICLPRQLELIERLR